MRRQDKQVSTTIATFQISQLFSAVARNLSGAKNIAFTMAEILLSLTIIGVVAAITLPSLTGNINERTWNTQRKALYARMSQAISLMPALNGYGTLVEGDDSTSAQDTATETFITTGLAKVLKINNICDNTHLNDCGIVTSFTNMAGSQISMPNTLYGLNSHFSQISYSGISYSTINTKAVAFETTNGESIIAFYNQSCMSEYLNQETPTSWGSSFGALGSNICVNFLYDLNGTKGPNTIGKDIGIITVFNATDSNVVAPMPASNSNAKNNTALSWIEATKACNTDDSQTRIPNIDELTALIINKNMFNIIDYQVYWSGSVFSPGMAWAVNTPTHGFKSSSYKVNTFYVRCVKR